MKSGLKTVVFVASPNPMRYSHMAVQRLVAAGYPVIPVGFRPGRIGEVEIQTERPVVEDVDTISMYLSPDNQPEFYDYLLSLKPRRIIFNPGTENLEFQRMCEERRIVTVIACTLVMLSTGQYA